MTGTPDAGGTEVRRAFDALKRAEARDGALAVEHRRALLLSLAALLAKRRADVVAAVDADFGRRSADETLIADVFVSVEACRHARRRLRRWARPRRVPVGAPFWPSRARLVPQPLGVVGVLSPWNYPVQLALLPLIGAVSAGNRVLLKPSELTPRTAALLAELLERALGPDNVRTVAGGADAAEAVTRLPLDHLAFTGSTANGRKVMAAAAENLVPLLLELGGKCPVIVAPDADLDEAARLIVAAKGLNAGQTCLAPDTAIVVAIDRTAFADALGRAARKLYPGGLPTAPMAGRPAERLARLSAESRPTPISAGADGERLATVEAIPGSAAAAEEIFGPLLVVEHVGDLDGALADLRGRPAPLAVYLFTRSPDTERRVLEGTRSGALIVNGGVNFAAMPDLPFGGVGQSGFGRYHGEAGFLAFSNMRAHVRQARWSLSRLLDPPYTARTRGLLGRILGRSSGAN